MNENKTPAQELQEKLTFTQPHIADALPQAVQQADEFCRDYMRFLDAAKTEREAVTEVVRRLQQAGYQPFTVGKAYAAGDKYYFVNRNKCVISCTHGSRPLTDGVKLMIAHIDSPRLDLKPNPLYESNDIALFKTHYYGGLRKYQWGATPLSLHGVIYKADGSSVTVNIGEEAGDPVFCVTDLLPHLAQEQSKRTLSEGLKGEELNILVGSLPFEDKDIKDR